MLGMPTCSASILPRRDRLKCSSHHVASATAASSIDLAHLALPERRAQLALDDLSSTGQRQPLIADFKAAWTLVAGDPLAAESDDIIGGHHRARLARDDGMDRFARLFAGNSDDGALRHGRMLRD